MNRGSGGGSAGAFTANLFVVSASPSIPGIATSFAPNPVSFAAGNPSKTSTLNIITSNLAAGTYTFNVKANTSASDFATSSPSTTLIVLSKPFTIRGLKFHDQNGNHVNNAEPALAGWTINLYNATTNTLITPSAVTGANGSYSFTNRGPGFYRVCEVLQPNWIQTFPASGASCSGAGEAPLGYSFTVLNGTDQNNKNFGNFKTFTIRGLKFHDQNANHVNNAEPALSGWTINLRNGTTGASIASTVTQANGTYSFSSLGPGSYRICEVLQPNWAQTFPASGASCSGPGEAPKGYLITAVSGTDSNGNDFGNFKTFTIRGMKFVDKSGNHVNDDGDTGLAGWTINLRNGTTGALIASTTTLANGTYSFASSGPGSYRICEVLLANWIQTFPESGASCTGTGEGAKGYSFTATSGTDSNGNDFGNFRTFTITGIKFNDLNGNHAFDAEPGLNGWKIQLYNATTGASINSDETHPEYTFSNLGPGTYLVCEVLKPNWIQTYPTAGIACTAESTLGYLVTGSSGSDQSGIDFGNFREFTIRGIKFNDLNGNHANDGEAALSGWTINLHNASTGAPISSTVTGVNGTYSFTDLTQGSYIVCEVLQTNWFQTAPTSGDSCNASGEAALGYLVNGVSGTDSNGNDFGNKFITRTIRGMKFQDNSGNHANDNGDNALAGWTINLRNDTTGAFITSSVTGANGSYSFPDLIPAPYKVCEVLQANWIQTFPMSADSCNGAGEANQGYSIVLTAEGDSNGNDFGNFRTITIRGMKFDDKFGNHVNDNGDTPLSGWTINLRNGTTGSFIGATTTAANGTYSFISLTPGTYRICEVLEDNWVETLPQSGTSCDGVNEAPIGYLVVAVSGTDQNNEDFGNFRKFTIRGLKFDDLNGNRANNAEPTLSGWTINLRNSTDGTLIASALTGANGTYSFTGLTPGSYKICEALQDNWIQTMPDAGAACAGSSEAGFGYLVVGTSGNDSNGNDFGNFKKFIIRGLKFDDKSGNHANDNGDTASSGWTINLRNGTTGDLITSTVTAPNGTYSFPGLTPGSYRVCEVLQDNWIQTYPQVGAACSGSNEASVGYLLAATSGADHNTKDFGNFKMFTIRGMKFNDMSGNHVKDNGDSGLAGWTINLRNATDGVSISSTTTLGNGSYSFASLTPGSYLVCEVLEASWLQTFPQETDSCAAEGTLGNSLTASSGVDKNGNDFGNFKKFTIRGIKFDDKAGNHIKDNGDSAQSGWTINLYNGTGALIASKVTGTNGSYSFTDVGPGSYKVCEVLQADWAQTAPSAGPTCSGAGEAAKGFTITGVSGTDSNDNDFGNFKLFTIRGLKFDDKSGDHTKNNGDSPGAGWTINVRDGTTGSLLTTTVTGANGTYSFMNLGPGSYRICEVLQGGWIQTFPTSGAACSGSGEGAKGYLIVAVSGTDSDGNDFGNFKLISIEGLKFNDIAGDHLNNNGDAGLSGWSIRLYNVSSGTLITSTNTVSSPLGNYSFVNLGPGSYLVCEVLQAGWIQTFPTSGASCSGAGEGANGYSITAISGQNITGAIDFGNFKLISINGMKFNDAAGNHIKDNGDAGLSGWMINLYASDGTTLLASTTTRTASPGPLGSYEFLNLGPGTYIVCETLQSGWVQTYPTSGTACSGTTFGYTITASSGYNVTAKDFGNFKIISIEGMKFEDKAGDHVNNNGDTSLSGWTIRLYSGASLVATTTTRSSGSIGTYSFLNLGPGTYSVCEVLVAGWTQTAPASGSTCSGLNEAPLGYSIAATSGQNQTTEDFGNFKLVSIKGLKFEDKSGDHLNDNSDGGLSGWTINLYASDGTTLLAATSTRTSSPGPLGSYEFLNLGPGTYIICEVLQNGWVQTYPTSGTACSGSTLGYTVAVSSGYNVTAKDFGNFREFTIRGIKFNDLNGNHANGAEPAVAAWTIDLRNATTGTPIFFTTTASNGTYSFTNLTPGSYLICEVLQANWIQTFPESSLAGTASCTTESTRGYQFTASSGVDRNGNDFGNFKTFTIRGMKFNDASGNKLKDVGDNGLLGWTINLRNATTGVLLTSTTTVGNGSYSISNLTPGSYRICEVLQSNWIQTFPASGTSCVGAGEGTLGYSFAAVSGTDQNLKDFGNFKLFTIRGVKYNDLNMNHANDAEALLSGWTIKLYNATTNVFMTTTATGANGSYSFTSRGPGSFRVCETLQVTWMQTYPQAAPACSGANEAAIGHAIIGASGIDQNNKDFGNVVPYKINNFMTDSDFSPISSLEVVFTSCGSTQKLTATNPGTYYYNLLFTNQGPASSSFPITITISPDYYLKGAQPVQKDGTPLAYTFTGGLLTVAAGPVAVGQQFTLTVHLDYTLKGTCGHPTNSPTMFRRPYTFPTTVNAVVEMAPTLIAQGKKVTAIGGFLSDTNGFAKGGLTVTIYDSSNIIKGTDVSSADGFYFVLVPAGGPYTVKVTNSVPTQVAIRNNLRPAQDQFVQVDINNLAPADPAIQGFVKDKDMQGVMGVTVELLNMQGKVVATTTTNAGGYYIFRFYAPGTYTIRITVPSGYSATTTSTTLSVKQFETATVNFSLTKN